MSEFNPRFIQRAKSLLGEEYEKFLEYSKKPLKKSIRVNTLKISKKRLLEKIKAKGWELKEIPWFHNSFLIEKGRSDLGNTLEHFLGYYYVQSSASMIPPLVLSPLEGEFVLDLCASPGSKTTQMAQMMDNEGIILANDKYLDRIMALRSNLQRCGVSNTVMTKMDGREFKRIERKFHKVLVDAPCSSEGNMRKDPTLIKRWNLNFIKRLSNLQKQLINSAFTSLKEGGILVYSTCTLAPEENEKVVNNLIEKHPDLKVEKIEIDGLKTREGITEWKEEKFRKEIKKCIRIYPQNNDTEGFFVAKLKK